MPKLQLVVSDDETPDLYVVAKDGLASPAFRLTEGSVETGFEEVVYVHRDGVGVRLTMEKLGALAAKGRVYPASLVPTAESTGDGVAQDIERIEVSYVAEPPTAGDSPLPSYALLASVDGSETPVRTTAYAFGRDHDLTPSDVAALDTMKPGDIVHLSVGLVSRPMPRIQPAETPREGKRRLLHARIGALHRTTGEDEKEIRMRAVGVATTDRTYDNRLRSIYRHPVTSSKLLDDPTASGWPRGTAELDDAITAVEDELYHAGFDFEADEAAYARRQSQRMGSAWDKVQA